MLVETVFICLAIFVVKSQKKVSKPCFSKVGFGRVCLPVVDLSDSGSCGLLCPWAGDTKAGWAETGAKLAWCDSDWQLQPGTGAYSHHDPCRKKTKPARARELPWCGGSFWG